MEACGAERLVLLIAVSVLMPFQHHVIDVPAGAALGAFVGVLTVRSCMKSVCRTVLRALR